MRGGKRPGAGRPEKDDHYVDAFRIWLFVENQTEELGSQKRALHAAQKEFGICKRTVQRNREMVGKVIEILAIAKMADEELFDRCIARLVDAGWFAD